MKYNYVKLGLKMLSFIAIGAVILREFLWAMALHREGILFLMPVAAFLPAIMVILFVSRLWEPKALASYSPAYRAVRSDLIKCIALLFAAAARLALFQPQ